MTCAEFRRLNPTNLAVLRMSRGERAGCRDHYERCPECVGWLYAMAARGPTATVAEYAEMERLAEEDRWDEEAR